jgi:hypothetical protein
MAESIPITLIPPPEKSNSNVAASAVPFAPAIRPTKTNALKKLLVIWTSATAETSATETGPLFGKGQ